MKLTTPTSAVSSRTISSLHWKWTLIVYFLVVPVSTAHGTLRVNYGAYFSKKATVSPTTKYVYKNLTIPTPTAEDFQSMENLCSNGNWQLCSLDPFVSMVIDQIRVESSFFIHNEIVRMLSELDANPIPFPQHLLSNVMFPSAEVFNEMRNTTEDRERQELIKKAMDYHWFATYTELLPADELPVIVQLTMLEALRARMNWFQYAQGFQNILQGRLDRTVVPEKYVQKEVMDIFNRKDQDNPRFDLEDSDVNNYYRLSRVKGVSLQDEKLTITVAFPVFSPRIVLYDLYEVTTFPLFHQSDVLLSTRLINVPRYLAVARDGDTYTEADGLDESSCEDRGDEKFCMVTWASRTSKNPSCLLAVFQNDTQGARSKCQFQVQEEKTVSPSAAEVLPNLVLWNNVTQIWVECPGQSSLSRNYSGCLQCLRYKPCGCSMRSEVVTMPPVLPCSQEHSDDEFSPENLGLLFRLFSPEELAEVDGSKLQTSSKVKRFNVTLDRLEDVLSQNPLGPFPMNVTEIRMFIDGMELNKKGKPTPWYYSFFLLGIGLVAFSFVTLLVLYIGLEELGRKIKDMKMFILASGLFPPPSL